MEKKRPICNDCMHFSPYFGVCRNKYEKGNRRGDEPACSRFVSAYPKEAKE